MIVVITIIVVGISVVFFSNGNITVEKARKTVSVDVKILEKLKSPKFLSKVKNAPRIEPVMVQFFEDDNIDSLKAVFAKEYEQAEEEDHQHHHHHHDHGHDEKMRDHVIVKSKKLEEIRKRLSLLSSLNKKIQKGDYSKKQTKKLLNLFVKVANTPNENWSVRRQAARNILSIPVSTEERQKILKALDKRILHLARFSKEELFDEAVTHGKDHQ